VSTCPVSPADVLRFALVAAAPAVVIGHNHPSGEPHPHPEGLILTERLVLASKQVGIQIVDHVIAGEDAHFSFLDAGLLALRSR
jgi:DNA repair protein RadC